VGLARAGCAVPCCNFTHRRVSHAGAAAAPGRRAARVVPGRLRSACADARERAASRRGDPAWRHAPHTHAHRHMFIAASDYAENRGRAERV
jgi:hypothetical protein